MSEMLGTFERSIEGVMIYKQDGCYLLRGAQSGETLLAMPRTFNIWQNGMRIWILARFGNERFRRSA